MSIETFLTDLIIIIPFIYLFLTTKQKSVVKPLYHRVWSKDRERVL